MIRRAIFLAVATATLVACAVGGGVASQEPSVDDEFTPPARSDPLASHASKSGAPGQRTVTGSLAFDDIEGGCTFLEAADGTRYEVVYPPGWLVDRAAAELRGPAGEVVPSGGTVTVTGSVARDRASICQVGPIFVATTVQP